jgi:hypothetical protein
MLLPAIILAALTIRHHPGKDEPLVPIGSADATRLALGWADLVPNGWDPMQAWDRGDLRKLPDTDPRARQALEEMQDAWVHAPTRADLEGLSVQLSGYVVPLDFGRGGVRDFLLVPYAGACIHTPPPPSNQIVHVIAAERVKGLKTMDTVTVGGQLGIERMETELGASGYVLKASHVAPIP